MTSALATRRHSDQRPSLCSRTSKPNPPNPKSGHRLERADCRRSQRSFRRLAHPTPPHLGMIHDCHLIAFTRSPLSACGLRRDATPMSCAMSRRRSLPEPEYASCVSSVCSAWYERPVVQQPIKDVGEFAGKRAPTRIRSKRKGRSGSHAMSRSRARCIAVRHARTQLSAPLADRRRAGPL